MSHQQAPKYLFVFVFILDWGKSLVLPTMQHLCDTENIWLDTAWQQPCQFQVEVGCMGVGGYIPSVCMCVCVCVHVCAGICVCVCVCARYQWPSDPLPSKISLSPLHHLYCLWDVLMCESKFYWIICGLQRYMGWCWSVQVFVFSSEAASVANVS